MNDHRLELVETYRPLIRATARRFYLRHRLSFLDPDDFEQIGKMGVLTANTTHNPEYGAISTWVWTIAWRSMMDEYRQVTHSRPRERMLKKGLTPAYVTPREVQEDEMPPSASDDCVEAKDAADAVMGTMSDREWGMSLLRFHFGYTLQQIADVYGISESMVCQIFSRVRERARKKLPQLAGAFR